MKKSSTGVVENTFDTDRQNVQLINESETWNVSQMTLADHSQQ